MFLSNLLHRTPKTCWVPPGHSVEVMGKPLPGGMVYVGIGKSLGGMSAVVGKGPEPALIDISLPVDLDNPSPVFRWSPDIQGYFAVGTRVKAHYLQWLAGGRQDAEVSTGCLMLFLFGLERRVLHDAKSEPEVALELPAIARELKRLLDLHGPRHAIFASHANAFLELLRVRQHPRPEAGLDVDPETFHVPGAEEPRVLPKVLREALGWVAVNGEVVSPGLAYAWFMQDPVFTHRSAVKHCPQQHKRLFYQRYAELFRDGLEPEGVYPKIRVSYATASPTFGQGFQAEQLLELPDLPARAEHVSDVRAIAEYCESRLAGFARFAEANPDRPQSLETLCHLPPELWPPRWRRPFENLAEEAGKGRNLPCLTFSQLVSWLPKPSIGGPDVDLYRTALQGWGLGLETGDTDVTDYSKVIVYPLPPTGTGGRVLKGEFELASIAYRLLLFVVKTDNAAPFNEYVAVKEKLSLWVELTEAERAKLGANLAWLLANPKGMLEGALIPLQGLGAKPKARIVEFLLNVSDAMGVEGLTLARMLARTNSKAPVTPASTRQRHHLEPVTVRTPGRKREAFAIPANPEPPVTPVAPEPPPRPVITLDMSRIAKLKEESAEVGAMLGAIFTETPESAPTPLAAVTSAVADSEAALAGKPSETAQTSTPTGGGTISERVMGLDAKHSQLARQLCEKPSWSREEALALCASLGLLLDGALERINEASFDAYDDPLVDGDDVLEINSEIASEIV